MQDQSPGPLRKLIHHYGYVVPVGFGYSSTVAVGVAVAVRDDVGYGVPLSVGGGVSGVPEIVGVALGGVPVIVGVVGIVTMGDGVGLGVAVTSGAIPTSLSRAIVVYGLFE